MTIEQFLYYILTAASSFWVLTIHYYPLPSDNLLLIIVIREAAVNISEIALIEKPLCHLKRRRLTPKALFETVNFFICDSKLHVSEEY